MYTLREAAKGTPALPSMGPVLEFMRVVWALDHAMEKTSKRMEGTRGITAPQRFVVRILGRFPGMCAGQMAMVLHVHPSTLTGILRRLQQRGLITRRADPRDRRRAVFGLTVKGREFDLVAEGSVEAAVHGILKDLPQGKIESAIEVLGTLSERLDSGV